MELYGPFSLAANTPTRIQVSMLARGVRILNGSQFDLHVSFSPPGTQPTAAGPFNVAVGPRGRESFALPPMLVQGGKWAGDLWVYPTLSTGQAISTVLNTSAVVRVEAYGATETLPQSTAVGTAYDQTSQSRVVCIPMTPACAQVIQQTHVALAYAQGFDPLMQLPPLTPPASGTIPITPYLYALSLTQMGALWAEIEITVAVEHGGGGWTIFNSFAASRIRLWAGVPWSPPLCPFGPVNIPFASTDTGVFLIAGNIATYPTGITPQYDGHAQISVDTSGQANIPTIGQGAQTQAGTFY